MIPKSKFKPYRRKRITISPEEKEKGCALIRELVADFSRHAGISPAESARYLKTWCRKELQKHSRQEDRQGGEIIKLYRFGCDLISVYPEKEDESEKEIQEFTEYCGKDLDLFWRYTTGKKDDQTAERMERLNFLFWKDGIWVKVVTAKQPQAGKAIALVATEFEMTDKEKRELSFEIVHYLVAHEEIKTDPGVRVGIMFTTTSNPDLETRALEFDHPEFIDSEVTDTLERGPLPFRGRDN